MNKISLNIDVLKITKSKLVERSYTNKDGVEIKQKDLKVDVIPLKEKTVLKEGDGWKLMKVGFVAEQQSKEEKANKTPSVIVGSATEFQSEDKQPSFDKDSRGKEIEAESIPF